MHWPTRVMLVALGLGAGAPGSAAGLQSPGLDSSTVANRAAVRIVERAEELLSAPGHWNRADSGTCPAAASTLSLYCALERASRETTGGFDDHGPAMRQARAVVDFVARQKYAARLIDYNNDSTTTLGDIQSVLRIVRNRLQANLPRAASRDCDLHAAGAGYRGTCGRILNGAPIFTVAHTKSIKTGAWHANRSPSEVWGGTMTDSGYADADVEIELYGGGEGIIRTSYGWFPVSNVSGGAPGDSVFRFLIDTTAEVPASELDLEILKRASAIITSDSVWNRQDDRRCNPAATHWSIYCAVERATRDVTGGFHHRRPAMELVREIIDERTKNRDYKHRMMDYNNDPTTRLADVRSLFAEAIARVK